MRRVDDPAGVDGEWDAWRGLKCDVLTCSGWYDKEDVKLARSLLLLHQLGGRSCVVTVDRREQHYSIKAGSFDFFPAGTYRHVLTGPSPMRATAVQIPVGFEIAVLEERGKSGMLPVHCQFFDRRLLKLVEALAQAGEADQESPNAVMQSVMIVDRLYEIASEKTPSDTSRFSEIMGRLVGEYIDYNIVTGVKLETLASATGHGRTQFARMFRNSFGMPLHAYVLSRKVTTAKEQLRGATRVTQIAHDLGFASHAHFTTTFRRLTGLTPSEFRDSLLVV
jgi:AraC-like DNA-binding protein